LIARAKVEILAIRWAMKRRRGTPESFEAAIALLRPVLSEELQNPGVYQGLAEIHSLCADWLAERGNSPAADIANGLAMAEKALSINPRMAAALATKGSLHLTQARTARDPSARAGAARLAEEVFADAFRNNPLLEREHGAKRAEAAKLR
jgi:hypothetical protein